MKLFLVGIIFLLFLYNFESVLGFLYFPREAFDITYEDLLVESKERPFHRFTSNFPNRNSFRQKLHMEPTLPKMPGYKDGAAWNMPL